MLRHWWRHDWGKILIIWFFWQLLILTWSALVTWWEPLGYQPTYPLSEILTDAPLPAYLARLGGFDGVHYQTIIRHRGYREIGGIQAFFPLYPILIWLLDSLTHQTIVSGLLISSVSLYGALYFFFAWAARAYDRRTSWWLLAILLTLPGSFFYLTVYTESLFLCLLAAMIYAYSRRRYAWVAILGILLSACRVVGIIAVVAVAGDHLFQAWREKRLRRRDTVCNTFIILLGAIGLIAYMGYLYRLFGDPLMFMHVQADFGAGRDASHLVLLPQVFWRYGKMFLTGFSSGAEAYRIIQEFLTALLVLAGLLWGTWIWIRRQKPGLPLHLLLFSWGAYLVGPATGNFQSLPRYVLVCLSVWVLLAQVFTKKRSWGVAFCTVCAVILACNLLFFLEGYLIA